MSAVDTIADEGIRYQKAKYRFYFCIEASANIAKFRKIFEKRMFAKFITEGQYIFLFTYFINEQENF